MDRIPVHENQVVAMEDIVVGVRGLRIAFVNVFAVTHPDGSWTLVDAGLTYTATLIQRWAERFTKSAPKRSFLPMGTSITQAQLGTWPITGTYPCMRTFWKLRT
jgi:hypothetical protein